MSETLHELKLDPKPYAASLRGDKPFEVRFNDRDFRVGDLLVLRETEFSSEEMSKGAPLKYTGRVLSRRVTLVTSSPAVIEGFVILGVRKV